MAAQKFEKGTEEYELFRQYYNFIQRYWINEKTDDWWDEVVTEGNKLAMNFKGNYKLERFAVHLIHSLTLTHDEVERKERNGK